MAEKGFGVKEINLIGASGTPTIESPNNLNLNAVNVAISTNVSIGGTLTVTGNVSVGGTLTYEDVTNIDSVGIITARDGVVVVGNGVSIAAGGLDVTAGVSTFTDIKIAEKITHVGDENTDISFGTDSINLRVGGNSKLNTSTAGVLVYGTILRPNDDNQVYLGTGVGPQARWAQVHAVEYYGGGSNLTGIAVTEAPTVDYTITANGSSAYRFHGGGVDETADDPDLYLVRGQKYRFNNTTGSGHPFKIRSASGNNPYTDGVTGDDEGVQFFTVPYTAPSKIFYQCELHSGMIGNIYIRGAGGQNTNVGITTFSDAVRIVKSSGPLLELTTNTSAADATLRLSEGAAGSTTNGGGMFYSGADNKLYITCGTDSTTKRITINRDDGKVGIGEDSPDELLHIASTGTAKFRLTDNRTSISTGSQYAVIQFEQRDSNTPGVSAEIAALMQDTSNGATALQFTTGTPSTIAERLRIHSDGKISIGSVETSTGLLLLDKTLTAESDASDKNNYHLVVRSQTNSNTSKIGIAFANTTDDTHVGAAILHHRESTDSIGSLAFYTSPSSGTTTERMKIDRNGYVTTSSQFHIEVQRSGNQTGFDARSSNAGTPVTFNDVVRTRGTANSALNTSTGKITVPVDGVYFLEASVYTPNNNISQGWFTEGSSRMNYSDITEDGNTDQIQCHGMHYLTASTEVGFHPYGASASSITIEASVNHTWFRVTLIG